VGVSKISLEYLVGLIARQKIKQLLNIIYVCFDFVFFSNTCALATKKFEVYGHKLLDTGSQP